MFIFKVLIFILCIILLILIIYIWYNFFANMILHRKLPPFVNSFWRQLDLLDKYNWKKWAKILDLGCGDGSTLRYIYHRYGLTYGLGYDINSFAIWRGQTIDNLYKLFGKNYNIELRNGDIYTANLVWRDYVYIYLFPDFMADMEDWLWDWLGSGTVIVCNTFAFIKHEPFYTISNNKGKIVWRFYKI